MPYQRLLHRYSEVITDSYLDMTVDSVRIQCLDYIASNFRTEHDFSTRVRNRCILQKNNGTTGIENVMNSR